MIDKLIDEVNTVVHKMKTSVAQLQSGELTHNQTQEAYNHLNSLSNELYSTISAYKTEPEIKEDSEKPTQTPTQTQVLQPKPGCNPDGSRPAPLYNKKTVNSWKIDW